MSVDAEVLDGFHDYLGLHPRLVNRDDDPLVIKSKIQDENPAEESGGTESSDTVESPAGRGRIVQLPPGRLTTDELLVPQSQSICGVKGSTILTLDSDSVLTDRTNDESGVAAYVTIGGEFRVRGGIAGQGVLQDLDIDATYSHEDLPEGINKLHGLYAPPREGNAAPNDSANVHTIRNVAVYNAFTNGIHLDQGNDKLVCDRMRSAVDSSDPKLRTHLRCDGNQYNSQDWPFAYLNVMAYYGTWTGIALTDDLLFTMPDLPAISPNCVPAIRAIP